MKKVSKIATFSQFSLDSVLKLNFSAEKKIGVAFFGSGILKTFFIEKNEIKVENSLEIFQNDFSTFSLRPDGRIFALGQKNGFCRIFGTKSMKILAILDLHKNAIRSLKFASSEFSSSKKFLAIGDDNGRISIWSLYSDVK